MALVPSLRRNVFIPLWVAKNHSPRLRYLREMEASQYLSPDELRQRSLRRLQEILNHAYANTDYYRKAFDQAGVHPGDVRSAEDLKAVPLLTKDQLRNHGSAMIVRALNGERLIPFKTGGSTGKPVTVYYTHDDMERGIGASLRSFRWTDWDLGEPIGRVWGNPPKKSLADKVRDLLLAPEIYLDTMRVSEESVQEFAHDWRRLRPTLLHGHAHSLFLLAEMCRELGISSIRPRAIISTSMMLLLSERALIEEVFSCRVTNLYGSEEVGLIACECQEHQGLHLNLENNFVEFLDESGKDAPPGVEGTIVVTNLLNRAMPIVRYSIEDVGIPSKRRCPCQRCLPLVERVTGRVADFLWRTDGSRVAGVSLIERTLTALPGIAQMQIIQETLTSLTVHVVPGAGYGPEVERALRQELSEVFGTGMDIAVRLVPRIEQERNGKYRFSVCRVTEIRPVPS